MLRIICLALLPLLPVACAYDAPLTEAPPPETEVTSVARTGGDTTAAILQLNFAELDLPERHYVVLRSRLSLTEMPGFLAQEAVALAAAAGAVPLETAGPPTAVFYEWDTTTGMGDAAVALPVAGPEVALPPYVTISLPATRALTLEVSGLYEKLGAAHYGLESEVRRRGLTPAAYAIEEYPVGPQDTDDPDQFRTRIIYPVLTPVQ